MLHSKFLLSSPLQKIGLVAAILLSSVTTDAARAGDLAIVQTTVSAPEGRSSMGESYRIYAGSFESQDTELWIRWLQTQLKRADGEQSYLQVVPVEQELQRTPQALNPRAIRLLGRKVVRSVNGAVLAPALKTPHRFMSWMKSRDNSTRFTFAAIATVVDGSVNGVGLFLYEGVSPEAALAVGATIAALSGSWSFSTVEIAKFLNGNPSVVDLIAEKKASLVHAGAKFGEGLLKWGLIQYAYLGVISAISVKMGVAHFDTLGGLASSAFWTALPITIGQGFFDYSLSKELSSSEVDPDPVKRREVLLKTYVLGTAAASLATVGGLAATLGLEFGDYLVYGLAAAGVTNFVRMEKVAIRKFIEDYRGRCKLLLRDQVLPSRSGREIEMWGSE